MVKLSNIKVNISKKQEAILNFEFDKGIKYFSLDQKMLFEVLSIKGQMVKEGEFYIDDFCLYPLNDDLRYAFVLNINSQIIKLNAIFVLPLSFKDKTRKQLKSALSQFKELPLQNDEQKIDKITKIIEVLQQYNVCYLLIDYDEEINKTHRELIEKVIEEHKENMTIFIYDSSTEDIKLTSIESIKEKQDDLTIDIIAHDKNNIEPSLKSEAASTVYGWKTMLKELLMYYLFVGLFSIFLSVCSFSSIYLIRENSEVIAAILIVLDIVFFFIHVYVVASTYDEIKEKINQKPLKLIFPMVFMGATIVGYGLGFGLIYLLSNNNIFVNVSGYIVTDWIMGIVVFALAIAVVWLYKPLSIGYVKLKVIFNRWFIKKDDDKKA